MSTSSFSDPEIRARLEKAQGLLDTDPTKAFAQLVPDDVIGDDESEVFSLDEWPMDPYLGVSYKVRADVYRFLLAHHVKAFGTIAIQKGFKTSWCLALYEIEPPTHDKAKSTARSVKRAPFSRTSERLYGLLLAAFPDDPVVSGCWVGHLEEHGKHEQLIDEVDRLVKGSVGSETIGKLLTSQVGAFLARNRPGDYRLSDLERALQALLAIEREKQWADEHDWMMEAVLSNLLPEELTVGRGEATNLVGDGWRGVQRAGKWLGKVFGGRESAIPRDEAVLKSCPQLLTPLAVEEILKADSHLSHEFSKNQGRMDAPEAAAIGATLGISGAWILSRIDPTVLNAMTFASAGHPESFWRLKEIAEQIQSAEGLSHLGHVSRLQGYVAEQSVMLHLVREGHQVEPARSPTEQGWDLRVDGHPVQVKNTLNPEHIREHLEANPDIPVIVNAEMADKFADSPNVWVDHALRHEDVLETTNETLNAMDNFGGLDDLVGIPIITIGFSMYRNFDDFNDARIDLETYAKRVGIDAAFRTAGSGAGALALGAIGSVVGPVGTVVGAAIGGVLGNLAGSTGSDAVNHDSLCDARDTVVRELSSFAVWFHEELLPARLEAERARYDFLEDWMRRASSRGKLPRTTAAFVAAGQEMLTRTESLNSWIDSRVTGGEHARTHAGWGALSQAGNFFHPELRTRLAIVEKSLAAYCDIQGAKGTGPATEPAPAS
jgi:hypothetical protein